MEPNIKIVEPTQLERSVIVSQKARSNQDMSREAWKCKQCKM